MTSWASPHPDPLSADYLTFRFLKQWLSLILALILTMPGIAANVANARPSGDVPNDAWYKDAVDYVIQHGIMAGYTSGNFGPEDQLSRAQFAAMLYRMDGSPQTEYKDMFSDVTAADWYATEVTWAANTGIIPGLDKGEFDPHAPISHQDQIVMLCRYAAYKGCDTAVSGSLGAFRDASGVSSYALAAMQWAAGAGLLQSGSDTLNPKEPVIRAEAAALAMRFAAVSAADAPKDDTQDTNSERVSMIYIDPAVKTAWDEFAVYLWGDGSNGSWPGTHLTEKNGEGYYVYRLPEDLQGNTLNVIFNNNNGGEQVEENWKIGPGEQKIWKPDGTGSGIWEDYVPQTIVYISGEYLKANAWEQAAVYIWGDHENQGWPGVAAELQTEGTWAGYWKYELPASDYEGTTENNVILNTGTGAGGEDNQADAGNIAWGEIKVMTADGRWVDAAQITAASVSMLPAGGTEFYTKTLEVTLRAPNCVSAVYQLNDADPVAFKDGDIITIGADATDGESITLALTGTNAAGAAVTASSTYTKHYNAGVEPVSVLFIGNSYTYYGELWSVFQKVAYSAGYNVNVDSVTEGSHRLYQFADPSDARGAVVERKLSENLYDIVFLQEQSVDPIINYERFESGATTLYNRIMQHNPDCRVILYQTWGRKSGSDTLTTDNRGWTNETMTYDVRYAYAKLGETLGLEVSPAGAAFFDVYSNHADTIELYNADLQHPSEIGTYLAALVHFQTVFGDKLDQVTYNGGQNSDTVKILKQAAKDAPENALKPHVYMTPATGTSFSGSIEVTLHAINVDSATYQIDDGKAVPYQHGDTVTIGSDIAPDASVTLKVTGVADGQTVTNETVYTKRSYEGNYVVIGWYDRYETTGLNAANVAAFTDALKQYMKESCNASDAQLADIVVRPYTGNVAEISASINADGDVDVLIGVGSNIDSDGNVTGVLAKDGNIGIGDNDERYIVRLTDSELIQNVYNWIEATYGA